jgi:hypothetical protein
MKVPISECGQIDLEAPTLPAYDVRIKGGVRWGVWCRHCRQWHQQGPTEGHRKAHCLDIRSPYWKQGYNLAFAGKWEA